MEDHSTSSCGSCTTGSSLKASSSSTLPWGPVWLQQRLFVPPVQLLLLLLLPSRSPPPLLPLLLPPTLLVGLPKDPSGRKVARG